MPCSKNAVLDNSSAILSLRISKRWARRQFWLIGPKRVLSCKLLGDKSRYQGLNPWLLSFATTVQTIEPPRYSKMKGKRTWLILFPQSIEFVSDGSNSDFQLIFCFSCKPRPNESILCKKWGWDLFRLIWLHDRRKSEPKDRLTFEQVAAVLCCKTDTMLLCTRARFDKNITSLNLFKAVIEEF